MAPWFCKRNDGQRLPSLAHAEARSNDMKLHRTLIYSTQFLHRQFMLIFIKKYQHITELPSSVQGDEVGKGAGVTIHFNIKTPSPFFMLKRCT
jgi:hypothetical protein